MTVKYLRDAFGLLFRTPRLWPTALVPLAFASLAYALVLVLGFAFVVPWVADSATKLGLPETVGWWTGSALFGVVWLLASGPVFMALFCLAAVPAWDALSRQVEVEKFGGAPSGRLSLGAMVFDIALRVFFAAALALTALILGFFGLGWVGALLVGMLLVFDTTAPSCARRLIPAWHQASRVYRTPGWFGLWIVASVLTMVPVINVLSLPWLVVSGTLLVASRGANGQEPGSGHVE